jgi:hypothetical protein
LEQVEHLVQVEINQYLEILHQQGVDMEVVIVVLEVLVLVDQVEVEVEVIM